MKLNNENNVTFSAVSVVLDTSSFISSFHSFLLCRRESKKSMHDVWIRWCESWGIDPLCGFTHTATDTHSSYSNDFCSLANRSAEDHIWKRLRRALSHRDFYYLHRLLKKKHSAECVSLCFMQLHASFQKKHSVAAEQMNNLWHFHISASIQPITRSAGN